MNSPANPQLEELFLAATELQDPQARAAFLDERCAGNAELRRRIEALLAAHDAPDSLLDQPVPTAEELPTRAMPMEFSDTTQAYGGEEDEEELDALAFLAPSSRPDSLGKIGQYEVLEVLGKGAFGIVYRAFDDKLQRVVALKMLAPSLATTSPARKRFLREARSSAAIRHENVVQVHDVNEQPLPHLVMEFIPGETLQQRLDRTGPLDAMEVVRIGRQIAEGLAAAHATGLIHRDIKPSNILVESGPAATVKITDFGLARAADDASLTRSGVVAGTPMYMAPEQAKGESLDHRADLFSLGSVMYVMATGRPPFRASSTFAVLKRVAEDAPRPMREIIPEVPEWLCRIIEKLHAKDADERFQSSREVADVLADCEAQLVANSKLKDFSRIPIPKSVPSTRISRKMKWVAAALFVIVLGSVGAARFIPPLSRYIDNRAELAFDLADPDFNRAIVYSGSDVVADVDLRSPPTISLAPGQYKLEVRTSNQREMQWWHYNRYGLNHGSSAEPLLNSNTTYRLDVVRGERVVYTAKLKPPIPTDVTNDWVQLFNGKDLTGWKPHPEQPGSWVVRDGILIGSTKQSHLFTERADFANFHLRAEAMLNQGGDSGIRFRAPFELQKGLKSWQIMPTGGYEAEFNKFPGATSKSGGVWKVLKFPEAPISLFTAPDDSHVVAGQWVRYEVIANGNRIITRINGVEVANCVDPENSYRTGHIALQCFSAQTTVRFRKIEIKELSSSEPPPAIAPFTSEQAKSHQAAWAKHLGVPVEFADEFGHSFRLIPPGEFEMGTSEKEIEKLISDSFSDKTWEWSYPRLRSESPVRKVHIESAFYAASCETTVRQFREFVKTTGYKTRAEIDGGGWVHDGPNAARKPDAVWNSSLYSVIEDAPIRYVVREDADAYCRWLSMKTGCDVSLPSEAQWEYACRAGTTTAWSHGNDSKQLKRFAWTVDTAGGPVKVVGRLEPNPFGLYDMHGNVAELAVNSAGGENLRGGSTADVPLLARSAMRVPVDNSQPFREVGFRIVIARDLKAASEREKPAQRIGISPSPAIAPFTSEQAKSHQAAWAKHLGVPVEFSNSVGMKFRLIPPGEFTMGSSQQEIDRLLANVEAFKDKDAWMGEYVRNEGPDRKVTIPQAFYLGETEVTVGQFREFAKADKYKTVSETNGGGEDWSAAKNGWEQKPEYIWSNPVYAREESLPVVFLAPADARAYCEWMGKRDGCSYALPSDEQWEYACRAGSIGRWSFGDGADQMKRYGWTLPHASAVIQPVGRLDANPLGLRDMHGNATEFAVSPQGGIILRGGRADDVPERARSAWRFPIKNDSRSSAYSGFRVALTVESAKRYLDSRPKDNVRKALRQKVDATKKSAADAAARFKNGTISSLELKAAELADVDARLALAEELKDNAELDRLIGETTVKLKEIRDDTKKLVDAGRLPESELDRIDSQHAKMKLRLAKLKEKFPVVKPEPMK